MELQRYEEKEFCNVLYLDNTLKVRSFFSKPRLICQHLHLENLCSIQHFIANTEKSAEPAAPFLLPLIRNKLQYN